jgi:hypothetical protein
MSKVKIISSSVNMPFRRKKYVRLGKWKKKEWEGSPRWHLEKKFDSWCYHLHQGMQAIGIVRTCTRLVDIPVQTSGGFQNTFLFHEKEPVSSIMWDAIQARYWQIDNEV